METFNRNSKSQKRKENISFFFNAILLYLNRKTDQSKTKEENLTEKGKSIELN